MKLENLLASSYKYFPAFYLYFQWHEAVENLIRFNFLTSGNIYSFFEVKVVLFLPLSPVFSIDEFIFLKRT